MRAVNRSFGNGRVATTSVHVGSYLPAALFDSVSRRLTSSTNPTTLSLSHPLVERGVGGVGGRGGGGGFYADEDDDEFSSNEEGSDSDQMGGVANAAGAGVRPARINKALLQNRGKIPSNARVKT